jgi:hypothetical protein
MRVLGLIAFSDFVRRFEAAAIKLGDALEKALANPAEHPRVAGIVRARGLTEVVKRLREWKTFVTTTEVAQAPKVPALIEQDLLTLELGVREIDGDGGLSTGTIVLIIGGLVVAGLAVTFLSSMASTAGVGAGTRIVKPRIQVDGHRRKSA